MSELSVYSYYSPVLKNSFYMIEIEGTNSHEAKSFEQCHVHVLCLIIIYCLVMRVLSNHRHLTLSHKILNTLVNLSDHRVQFSNLIYFNPSCFRHFLIFPFILLFIFLFFNIFKARMDCEGNLLRVKFVFHIWEYKWILPR